MSVNQQSPPIADRTAIEQAIEAVPGTRITAAQTTSGGVTTPGLIQIPIYDAENPLSPDVETQPLNRNKQSLDPDGVALGAASYGLTGKVYAFPNPTVVNIQAPWMDYIRSCGYKMKRYASKRPVTSALSVAAGTGTGLTGDFEYAFTHLLKTDGTTVATTESEAVYESVLSAWLDAPITDTVAGLTNDSVDISALPSAGIKRVYRREITAGVTDVNATSYRLVGTVASGTTTMTDSLVGFFPPNSAYTAGATNYDANEPNDQRGDRAPVGIYPPATALAATAGVGTGLTGTYTYIYTVWYQADGVTPATTAAEMVIQSYSSLERATPLSDPATLSNQDGKVDVLPLDGIKWIYRKKSTETVYKFVKEVADQDDGPTLDTVSDATAGVAPPNLRDEVTFMPVSDYEDFEAMTSQSYLDDDRAYPAVGCRGNMVYEGTAGAQLPATFDVRGQWNDGEAMALPDEQAPPALPPQLCNMECTLVPEGEAAYTPVVMSVGINLGRTPAPRMDGNASCESRGLREFQINGRPDPRFNITMEHPRDRNFFTDWKTGTKFHFSFLLGNDEGGYPKNVLEYSNALDDSNDETDPGTPVYGAQIIERPGAGGGGGNRPMSLSYQLGTGTNSTGNSMLRIRQYRRTA